MSAQPADNVLDTPLAELDPEIAAVLDGELARQRDTLEMIASENFVPRAVLQAQGSVLTNKYAEGYPGRVPSSCTGRRCAVGRRAASTSPSPGPPPADAPTAGRLPAALGAPPAQPSASGPSVAPPPRGRASARTVSIVSASAAVLSSRYRTTRAKRSASPPG